LNSGELIKDTVSLKSLLFSNSSITVPVPSPLSSTTMVKSKSLGIFSGITTVICPFKEPFIGIETPVSKVITTSSFAYIVTEVSMGKGPVQSKFETV